MTKKCSKCDEVKPLEEFYKNKNNNDGRFTGCKGCMKQDRVANKEARLEYARKYREANKEAIAERSRQYREANKEAIAEYSRQYREANKEAIKEYNKNHRESRAEYSRQYRAANKEACAKQKRQYREANRGLLVEKSMQYIRKRKDTDPIFRLKCNIRCLIYKSLRDGGYSKKSRTHEILGCSYEEYYQHIEDQFKDGMSWERMSEIHIDHRLPLSAATTEAELLALNHHRNLQPLWSHINMAKGSSYCPKELAAYFAKHL